MNLDLARESDAVPSAEDVTRRLADALCVPAGPALPPRTEGVALHALVDAGGPGGIGVCQSSSGVPAQLRGRSIVCPHDPAEEAALDARVQAAARLPVDGVVLDRPDVWFEAGAAGAGFCASCGMRLNSELGRQYGSQYAPYDVLRPLAAAPEGDDAPFWREFALLRLRSGIEHGARLARRARDEARKVRREATVGASFEGTGAAAVRLAQKLDFAVVPASPPAADHAGIGRYEIFHAALARRPLVALADDALAQVPARVLQAARIAGTTRTELALPPGAPAASHATLAAHRAFWKQFRTRYRPPDPYAEVLVLYSPECDHLTRGAHGNGVRAAAEALTAIGAQYRIVLETPKDGSDPILLVDARALPEAEAARVERRVAEGASVVVVGGCRAADENGRPLEGAFDAIADGLNKSGTGTVFGIDVASERPGASARRFEPLVGRLEKALESLLGRGRRAAGGASPWLVVKLYLDPDRKLDVHLAGRAFDPATGAPTPVRGAVLYLSGAVVSGARSAFLFRAGAPEKRVALAPFGMGVQAPLPDFEGDAVLTVDR